MSAIGLSTAQRRPPLGQAVFVLDAQGFAFVDLLPPVRMAIIGPWWTYNADVSSETGADSACVITRRAYDVINMRRSLTELDIDAEVDGAPRKHIRSYDADLPTVLQRRCYVYCEY